MLKQSLIDLGFTNNRAEVYLALWEMGTTNVGPLVEKTGFHRNIIYRALKELINEHLVKKTIIKGLATFSLDDQNHLIDQFVEKERRAREMVSKIKRKPSPYPEVLILTGSQGVIDYFNLELEVKQNVYLIGINYVLLNKYREIHQQYEEKRIKKGIKLYILAHHSHIGKEQITRLAETRFLSKSLPDSPLVISIFGDYVIQYISANPDIFVMVKEKQIAAGYMNYFQILWEQSKK